MKGRGCGLFAAVNIKIGTAVACYPGMVMTVEQAETKALKYEEGTSYMVQFSIPTKHGEPRKDTKGQLM